MHIRNLYTNIAEKYKGNDRAFITHSLQGYSLDTDNIPSEIISEPEVAYYASSLFNADLVFDIPFPPTENPEFTFIDLFAGIGGFRIPLQWEKGKCVFSSESNQYAQNVYASNYGEYPFGDITKIPLDFIPEHDILCAGFPCQPFSISGKMKGFEDTRGTLI